MVVCCWRAIVVMADKRAMTRPPRRQLRHYPKVEEQIIGVSARLHGPASIFIFARKWHSFRPVLGGDGERPVAVKSRGRVCRLGALGLSRAVATGPCQIKSGPGPDRSRWCPFPSSSYPPHPPFGRAADLHD